MARFVRLDSQVRANRLIRANHVRVPEPNSLFCSRFGAPEIANRRFEAIRANHSNVVMRIDSRNLPRFALRIAGPSKSQGLL